VSGFESRESARSFEVAVGQIGVKILKQLEEGVGIAFGMSRGVGGVVARFRGLQPWTLGKQFARTVATTNPEIVGGFGIEDERAFGAVDFEPKASFAPRTDLGDGHHAPRFILKVKENGGVVIGRDHDFFRVAGTGFLKGFDRALGTKAGGQNGVKISTEIGDLGIGKEHGKVEPMRANVGDGAKFATELRFESPVPVGGEEQPVLKKTAVNEFDLTDGTFADERASFLAERIVTEVVGNTADAPSFLQQRNESSGLARIESEGLFAENVFAGAKEFAGFLEVEVVGSAEMNDVDGRIRGELSERLIGARQSEGVRGSLSALRRASEDASDVDSQAAKSIEVSTADETEANNGSIHVRAGS